MRWSQAAWERHQLDDLPAPVAALVREGHQARLGLRTEPRDSPVYLANQWLGEQARDLKRAHLTRAFDEQAIRDGAENYSRLCGRMRTLPHRRDFARYHGIPAPQARNMTDAGEAARLDDPLWWRRQLRKSWTRSAENALRRIGLVRKGRDPYASEYAVRHRRAQKRRMTDFLDAHSVVSDEGETLPLLPLAQRSVSNPAIRRGEFMTRVRGFEDLARDHDHVAEFMTLTAPSYFHAQLAAGGANPLFVRAVVREAQAWLSRMWARARAKLHRLSIALYGFRIAEPHHDATPHWHLLCFLPAHHVDALRAVVSACWLSEYADEPGARAHRCKFESIDPKKGTAAGYVAKYIGKNLDPSEKDAAEQDYETGAAIADSIARVDAWASVHGIRQFQQIGGAAVGLWREARRLRAPVDDPALERARLAADAGDWRAFVYAADPAGLHAHRKTALTLESIPTPDRNRYGEPRGRRVVGLRLAAAVAITRPYRWHIERTGSATERRPCGTPASTGAVAPPVFFPFADLGPVAITVRATPDYAFVATVPFRAPKARAGPPKEVRTWTD